jgi:predicted SAM-dependent methyltransferase
MMFLNLTSSFRDALTNLKEEWRILKSHRAGEKKARNFSNASRLKLNLGCGQNHKDGWVNIDIGEHADLTLDLREPLPLPENSCSIVYSEHFLEHLDYPAPVTKHLQEVLRILEPGGVISIGVPDTEWPVRAYSSYDEFQDYYKIAKERWHPKWCQTKMEHINHHFRQNGLHKFAFDFETLKKLLESCGFIDVLRRDYDPEIDTERRSLGTLYVRAEKPKQTFAVS